MYVKNPPKCPSAPTKPNEVPSRYLKVPPNLGGIAMTLRDVKALCEMCDGAHNSTHKTNAKPGATTDTAPSPLTPMPAHVCNTAPARARETAPDPWDMASHHWPSIILKKCKHFITKNH